MCTPCTDPPNNRLKFNTRLSSRIKRTPTDFNMSKLIYTETDEAPMLATYSLLPVIQRFAKPMGIEVSRVRACQLKYSVLRDK